MRLVPHLSAIVATAALILPPHASAEDAFHVVLENHRFVPAEIVVPAGQTFRLIVENRDATDEEFESYDLNRERIVPAKGSIALYLGPLEAGDYDFFGELNLATAGGRLVAR